MDMAVWRSSNLMKPYNHLVYTNDLITNTCLRLHETIQCADLVEAGGGYDYFKYS